MALGPYCACQGDPRVWGEVLQFLLEQENTPTKHESVDSLLMAMAVALPPATLGPSHTCSVTGVNHHVGCRLKLSLKKILKQC